MFYAEVSSTLLDEENPHAAVSVPSRVGVAHPGSKLGPQLPEIKPVLKTSNHLQQLIVAAGAWRGVACMCAMDVLSGGSPGHACQQFEGTAALVLKSAYGVL